MKTRVMYLIIPKSKNPSLEILSAYPCPMRYPAPRATLWGSREEAEMARKNNESLSDRFMVQEVLVTIR